MTPVNPALDGRLTRKARLASECGYMAVDDGDGLDVPAGDQLADDLIIRLQALGERRGGEPAVVGARTRRHMVVKKGARGRRREAGNGRGDVLSKSRVMHSSNWPRSCGSGGCTLT